jgi:hypothetical protein
MSSGHEYVGEERSGSYRSSNYGAGALYWPLCSCGQWSGLQTSDRAFALSQHAGHVAAVECPAEAAS